jgi:hypothetical protein
MKQNTAPIDKLGLAITDAGYKWTPKMKNAYNDSIHEREQFIEKITQMFDALIEASTAAHFAKRKIIDCGKISGDVSYKVRTFKVNGLPLYKREGKEKNT